MQAEVVVLDRDIDKPAPPTRSTRVTCRPSRPTRTRWSAAWDADLVIGAVLVAGAKAPALVSNDLSADEVRVGARRHRRRPGRLFEDTRPTTHDDPTYRVHESVFYRRGEHAGRRPQHLHPRADQRHAALRHGAGQRGTAAAVHSNRALAHGVNVVAGQVVLPEVAEAHGMAAVPLEEVLNRLCTAPVRRRATSSASSPATWTT